MVFIVSGFFAVVSAVAQEAEVMMGPELQYAKRSTLKGIVGYDQTGFYALRTNALSSKLNIVKYNNDLKEVKSVHHSLKIGEDKRAYKAIVQLNERLFLLTNFSNKKTKRNTLYAQEIDKESLSIGKNQMALADIDFAKERKSNSGSFRISVSRDSSKFLVYYELPWNRGESEKFGFKVYDETMKLLWKKEVTLPYLEELFEPKDYEVTNDGKVLMLGRVFADKKKLERRGKPNYTYHILSYTKEEPVVDYPIKNADKYFVDMAVTADGDGNIICAGFYSKNGTYSVEGSYYVKLNSSTKSILVESFKEFGLDFLKQNLTEKGKKKMEKNAKKGNDTELFHIDLDDIVLRDDGGAVLVGEQYFVSAYTTTDSNGNRSTTYTYRYNDIVVVNIDPLGEITWNQKIAKKQVSTNDGGFFSSYVMAIDGSKMHFVFNDNAKNLMRAEDDKIYISANNKETLITMVTLSGDGTQSRKALFAARDAAILARPKVCRQISEKELVVYGQRKVHRFAKVIFD